MGAATREDRLVGSYRTKCTLTTGYSSFGVYPRELRTYIYTMVVASSFIQNCQNLEAATMFFKVNGHINCVTPDSGVSFSVKKKCASGYKKANCTCMLLSEDISLKRLHPV